MLRAARAATGLLLLTGSCLWESACRGNAPRGELRCSICIAVANPTNHEIAVTNLLGAPCLLELQALPEVYSPRAASLSARFLLNYGDTTFAADQPLALGGNGQTDFPLQVSTDPHIYVLPTEEIALVDFLGRLDISTNSTNVLWVFVSDDFSLCPSPSSFVPTSSSSSSTQTLDCFTTSWSWVIDLSACALLSHT